MMMMSSLTNKIKEKWKTGLAFVILLVIINCIPFDSNSVGIEIRYSSDSVQGTAQIFCLVGRSYTEENSVTSAIKNGTASFELEKKNATARSYRIDFVNVEQSFGILDMSLYSGDKVLKTIPGEELRDYIEYTVDVEENQTEDSSLVFKATSIDSQIHFNKEFARMVHSGSHTRYSLENLFLSVIFILLFGLCVNARSLYNDFKTDHKRVFYYFCAVFIGITIVVYWKYLVGNTVFLFGGADIASDSFYQTFPDLVYQAQKISQGVWWEHWNSHSFLGSAQGVIYPTLNNWIVFFGTENVAYLMGVSQFLKVLLAGFFFYAYLRTMKISRGVSSIFAMGYAYSAHIIIRGSWRSFPSEVVLVAVWLFCFERFYVKKDYKWLPLATGLFFLNLSGYHAILYTGIFCVYGVFRYYSEHFVKEINRHVVKEHVFFVISLILGWLISSIYSKPYLGNLLRSNRVIDASGVSDVSGWLTKGAVLKSAYFRTLGNSVMGLKRGDARFIETLDGPTFYCGILALLLVLVGILGFERRKRIWYILGYIVAAVYIVCVPLRKFANGLRDEGFLMSSFWIVILLLLTASHGLEGIKQSKIKLKLSLYAPVFLVYVLGAFFSYTEGVTKIYLFIAILLLMVYGALLLCLHRKINFALFNIAALVLTAGEVLLLSYPAVNDRSVLSAQAMEQKINYNDYTVEAAEYLESIDDTFYRVDKDYNSVFLCDSLYQGYNGTKGYVGGAGIDNALSDFCVEFGFPLYHNSHYAYGFSQSTAVNTLLNVKYILTKEEGVNNYGYAFRHREGDVNIYENSNGLPLGNSYYQYILREDFENLTIAEKRHVIMEACVVDEKPKLEGITKLEEKDINNSLDSIKNVQQYLADYEMDLEDQRCVISFQPIEEGEVAVVKLNITNNSQALYVGSLYTNWGDTVSYMGEDTSGYFRDCFVRGRDEYIYEFNQEGIHSVSFGFYDSMELNEAEVYVLPKDIYYEGYLDSITKLSGNSFEVTGYSETEITGSYQNDTAEILFWAIPYNDNWHLYVDGEAVPIIRANIGFMGAQLQAGSHEIVLRYEADVSCWILTATGVGLYALYFIICIRMRKASEKNDQL